jgi:hypothetical protein
MYAAVVDRYSRPHHDRRETGPSSCTFDTMWADDQVGAS